MLCFIAKNQIHAYQEKVAAQGHMLRSDKRLILRHPKKPCLVSGIPGVRPKSSLHREIRRGKCLVLQHTFKPK